MQWWGMLGGRARGIAKRGRESVICCNQLWPGQDVHGCCWHCTHSRTRWVTRITKCLFLQGVGHWAALLRLPLATRVQPSLLHIRSTALGWRTSSRSCCYVEHGAWWWLLTPVLRAFLPRAAAFFPSPCSCICRSPASCLLAAPGPLQPCAACAFGHPSTLPTFLLIALLVHSQLTCQFSRPALPPNLLIYPHLAPPPHLLCLCLSGQVQERDEGVRAGAQRRHPHLLQPVRNALRPGL